MLSQLLDEGCWQEEWPRVIFFQAAWLMLCIKLPGFPRTISYRGVKAGPKVCKILYNIMLPCRLGPACMQRAPSYVVPKVDRLRLSA